MNNTDREKLIQWNNELARTYIVNDIFLSLYLVFGVFGNAVVVIVYKFRMKKKDDRYFIPFLAELDLLACLFRSSFELVMNLNPVNFQESLLCKGLWFPTNVFAIASIFLLLVIAVQRYLKICRPFGHQMTLFWKRLAFTLTICIAVAFSTPLIVYNDEIQVTNPENNITGYVCDIDVEKYYGTGFLTYTVIASFSSLTIMIGLTVFNILIARTICKQVKAKHKRSMILKETQRNTSGIPLMLTTFQPENSECLNNIERNGTRRDNLSDSNDQVNINSSKISKKMAFSHRYSFMFMAIGVAFILSYAPRLIILAVSLKNPKFFGRLTYTELALVSFSREMNVVNNVVNPFIYGFFDVKFRKETKKLLCRRGN